MIWKLTAFAVLAICFAAIPACNTTEGVGEDLQGASRAVERETGIND